MGELAKAGADIAAIVGPESLAQVTRRAADTAEKSVLVGADAAVGGRGLSGHPATMGTRSTVWPGQARIDFTPKGLWVLAEFGRRRVKGKVRPKSAPALRTPWGPRASVKGSTARGSGALTKAYNQAERDVPEAVGAEFDAVISAKGF